MRAARLRFLSVVLPVVLAATHAASAFGQQAEAEAYVAASWSEAQALARVLVARDFQEVINEVANSLTTSAGTVDREGLMAARREVVEALMLAASANLADVATSEQQLDRAMKLYRDATARRYRLSWYSVQPLVATAALPKLLRRAHEGLGLRCAHGAALPAADFLTAPRPALPGFRLNFTGRLWYRWGAEGGGVGADLPTFRSGGPEDDNREFWYGVGTAAGAGICVAFGIVEPNAVSLCAAAGAALVDLYYALTDLLDHNREIEAMAAAEAYRLNNRAVAKDVSTLYKQYCGYGVDALGVLVAATEMTVAEQDAFLAETKTPTFVADVEKLLESQEQEQLARCRISLRAAMTAGRCPALGSPLVNPVYEKDPTCTGTDDRGVNFDCPLVATQEDSFCRAGEHGTLHRLAVEYGPEGRLRIRNSQGQADQPLCQLKRVDGAYSTRADEELLKALELKRRDVPAVGQEARLIAKYLATGVVTTLQAADRLARQLERGEEELDRQQAFALRNIQRLIRIVRLRRRALEIQARLAVTERSVAGPAVESLLDLTAAMIQATDDPSGAHKIPKLSEAVRRTTTVAATRLPKSATIDQLRIMAEQLNAVNQ